MDLNIVSNNLNMYMAAKDLSTKELSLQTGLHINVIRNAIKGKGISFKDLCLIADVLRISVTDLLNSFEIPSYIRYRATSSLKNWYILRNITAQINNYSFLEQLLDCKISYGLKNIPFNGNIENFATTIRQQIGLDFEQPIQQIIPLMEDTGIKIILYPDKSSFFGMALLPNADNPAIVVNNYESIPVERQIFSLVHELGHLLLHTTTFNNVSENSKQFRMEEKQADQFAGSFLLPTEQFITYWDSAKGLSLIDRILHVKSYFQVSYKSIIHKLIELKLGNNTYYPRFYIGYKRLYGSLGYKEEPKAIKQPLETHKFQQLVLAAYEQEEISSSRAAQLLNLSLEEFLDEYAPTFI